jgi:hypothetical protein
MVLLRLLASSLILLALARPRLDGRTAADWRPVLALGLALGAMNWAFYESFARIPLGAAVTIEFVGPLALAAVGRRRPRAVVWVGLAALGVVLFGAGPTKVDALGFGLALLAGGCWALYIVSTAATGRRWAGVEQRNAEDGQGNPYQVAGPPAANRGQQQRPPELNGDRHTERDAGERLVERPVHRAERKPKPQHRPPVDDRPPAPPPPDKSEQA